MMRWISDTSVFCRLGLASQQSLVAMVTAGRTSLVSLSLALTVDTAILYSVSPITPMTASASVTLLAVNTDGLPTSSTTRLGRTNPAAKLWVSQTTVLSKTPVAHGTRWPKGFTGSASSVTFFRALSFNLIFSDSMSGTNIPLTAGTLVTLASLLSPMGNIQMTCATRFGLSTSLMSSWRSSTTLICKLAPVGDSRSTLVRVSAAADEYRTAQRQVLVTLSQLFSYDRTLLLSTLKQNSPHSGGTFVTLALSSGALVIFGSQRAAIGASPSPTVRWCSETSLAIKSLLPTAVSLGVSATSPISFLRTSSLSRAVSAAGPWTRPLLTANFPASASVSVTLLGTSSGLPLTSAVQLSGTRTQASVWTSYSSVCVKVAPSGLFSLIGVVSSLGPVLQSVSRVWSTDAMTLRSLFAGSNLIATGSVSCTIFGGAFLLEPLNSGSCGLQRTEALSSLWTALTSVRSKAPLSDRGQMLLRISGNPQRISTLSLGITMTLPRGLGLGPSNTALGTGSQRVTVLGNSFGAATTSQVSVGPSAVPTTIWLSSSSCAAKSLSESNASRRLLSISVGVSPASLQLALSSDFPTFQTGFSANIPATSSTSISINMVLLPFADFTPVLEFGRTSGLATGWLSATTMKGKSNSALGRENSSSATILAGSVRTIVAVVSCDRFRIPAAQAGPSSPNSPLSGPFFLYLSLPFCKIS